MRALPIVLALAACTSSRTVGQPTLSVREDTITLVRRDKVDILFMMDDSPSTAPKRIELRNRFPELLTRIQTLATSGAPASFHIGVVDSDLGAGPFTLNAGQCHPGGDGGILRTAPAVGGQSIPAACSMLTLGNGESFIDYDSATGTSNVSGVDVATAFSCIAEVGDAGCGFEHPLEAVYRALTDTTINSGFLRDDALLVVVWLTDEDDCSAPPDSPLFDPSSAGVAQYGTLHSFRCTQFGITCDGNPLTSGALAPTNNCAPAPGGLLFDVQRYATLFNATRANGGIKDSPADVLLVSIIAPSAPVAVDITQPCADQVNTPSCPILRHSCVAATNAQFFADPAVRIHALMSSSLGSVEGSICDTDYTSTVDAMADAMAARMRAGCLPGAVVDRSDPGCVVTVNDSDTPRCTTGRLPCWDLVDDVGCPARPTPAGAMQQLRFTIEGAAPNAAVVATCPLYEP
jgi:hypothetical protein